jgi:hypothetical protein
MGSKGQKGATNPGPTGTFHETRTDARTREPRKNMALSRSSRRRRAFVAGKRDMVPEPIVRPRRSSANDLDYRSGIRADFIALPDGLQVWPISAAPVLLDNRDLMAGPLLLEPSSKHSAKSEGMICPVALWTRRRRGLLGLLNRPAHPIHNVRPRPLGCRFLAELLF